MKCCCVNLYFDICQPIYVPQYTINNKFIYERNKLQNCKQTGDINRILCPCSIACFAVHFFPSPEARYIESRAVKK